MGHPNQCVCSQHGKELNNLPSFSFKLRIDQGRKLKTYHGREHLLKKISSLFIKTPAFYLCLLRWLLFLRLDPTTAARIDRKVVFTKFVLIKPWSQQNPGPPLPKNPGVERNHLVWNAEQINELLDGWLTWALHVSLSRNRPIALTLQFYVSSLQDDHL